MSLTRTNHTCALRCTLAAVVLLGLIGASTGQEVQAPAEGSATRASESGPAWGAAEIGASWVLHAPAGPAGDPGGPLEPGQRVLVLGRDQRQVSLVAVEQAVVLHRLSSRFDLGIGPIYASHRRHAYLASRDGWVGKLDLRALRWEAEVRAGLGTRALALSHDDRFLIVANASPNTLAVLDAGDLRLVKLLEVRDRDGRASGVASVRAFPARGSFAATLEGSAEVWEISYRIPPPAGFGHWTHDHRKDGGDAATPEPFPVRRLRASAPLGDFFLTRDGAQMVARTLDGAGGEVVDFDLGRSFRRLDLPAGPRLDSAVAWPRGDTRVLAVPNDQGGLTLLDARTWTRLAELPVPGHEGFLASHEGSPLLWAGSPRADTLTLIDKQTLEPTHGLRPLPGAPVRQVVLSPDGGFALAVVEGGEDDLAVVYDGRTLEELGRVSLPRQP